MSKKYYVYCAYGINDEVLYIGKGSGNRYQHCSSGASANRDLNRYYFSNGENSIGIYVKSRGSVLSVSLYKNGELLSPKDVYSVNRYLKKRCFKLRLSVKDFK